VVIYHGNGVTTRYGHLSEINVEAGQRIRRGEKIGNVGSTGRSTGPHCHYEVRINNDPVDPVQYAAR
jgi:murein DD-endopeptidase MepM/ murein hydrolase activator NlpD